MAKAQKCLTNTNDRPIILCPCPPPKRLLTSSNWISRNDSSNINAILHPENYLFSPRLKHYEKTEGDVTIKTILSRNNCYCRCKSKNLPRPTFFKRPNSCVSYEGLSKTEQASDYEGDLKRRSLSGCVCDDVDGDDDGDGSAKPLKFRAATLKQTRSLPADFGLKYSDQRKKYEEYRRGQQEKLQEKVAAYEDDVKYRRMQEEEGDGDSGEVDTILGTQKYGSTTSASNYEQYVKPTHLEGLDDIPTDEFPTYPEWSVPDFRREHYFETHNIGKLGDMAGDASTDQHSCVHQFKLDNRWLPLPLNQDAFGRSVCKTCEKPMEGSSINLSSGYSSSGGSLSKSKIKNYAEAYKNGLSPTSINLGRGNTKVELVLDDNDFTKLRSYISKCKAPIYSNSLALRQQRLRMI